MDALDWLGWWCVRVAEHTVVCLALGVWLARAVSARLRPAAHTILSLALVAAIATPNRQLGCEGTQ